MSIGNEYEGKTVLVTGGAGCIGTNLCRKLSELNAEKVISRMKSIYPSR
ncbi:MAG: hypothetical protein DNFNHJIP_00552 [Candidatus Argoarchaeum ethanivorans]|uniref:NAD-dependent epimerase/dehydratase domain-containing protein n=1 Tax=Candidatus Argoarchaeum ethanivorans TaxID=2608793 RepID=A0A812A2X5_9EURY|nr:MAG: hypothetical protein DNFNHJIP_00552 [Candidatus Argoarchaeum ethanivorans]